MFGRRLSACIFLFLFHIASQGSVNEYMHRCLKSGNQKPEPSSEESLYGQCAPYKDNSCCTRKTSEDIHTNKTWLKFDWNHCPGRSLPEACRRHFVRDLCFYECSPNKGPWIGKVNMQVRQERFMGVPLCQSDCDAWWEACKTAYTCLPQWTKGFDWSTGVNKCPDGSRCRPFTEVFLNSETFCENVWVGSWKVTPESQPCMKLSFTGVNPNTRVARVWAKELTGAQASLRAQVNMFYMLGTSAALGIIIYK